MSDENIVQSVGPNAGEQPPQIGQGSVVEAILRRVKDSKISSIGLFIDGGYYALVDEALIAESRRIYLKGLIKYIQKCIAEKYVLDPASCLVTECHFFRGRYRAGDAKMKKKLESDRRFEDRLIENDVIFHYKHVYDFPDGSVHEKGIDVWFALETFELAMYRDFDFVVLITGDADHEMLAKKIKALKKQVVLVTWNYQEQDSTSKLLKEEVTYHININKHLAAEPNLKNQICQSASSY